MKMLRIIARKIRGRETPFWDGLYRMAKFFRSLQLPRIRSIGSLLIIERGLRHGLWYWFKNQYCNQIMGSYCTSIGRGVVWDGDVPMVIGAGDILIGDNVRIGNRQTWILGFKVYDNPRLQIGDNTTINYQTVISVAREVRIGSNCLLAGEIKIFDNNSHPVDFMARRNGGRMTEQDIAPVVIEDDVWIGTECMIMKGVTIGRGAVVAAGSVVTRNVAPFSLVAGVPAKEIRKLDNHMSDSDSASEVAALSAESACGGEPQRKGQ